MIGYEPNCLYPLASSTQQVPCAFVLWVIHQLKIGVPTLWSSWSSDVSFVLFSLFIQRFQVLKSFYQEVLSSRVKGVSHWPFSYCVYYTLCRKYGSDTCAIHCSIAGYFAYITKTVSRWILPRWYFHEFSLLVFIQWLFKEFNYWSPLHQSF